MRQFYILLSLLYCSSITFAQVSYSGNGNTGFGGVVGEGSLSINDDGTTITCTLTRGSGNFANSMVMYIDNGTGGRNVIDGNVNDFADDNRAAISNIGSGDLTFPAGFEATHAVAIEDTSFGGLWLINPNGSVGPNGLLFIDSVGNPTSQTFTTFDFVFDWSEIGLTGGDTFSFVITYGNPNDSGDTIMASSNEAFGGGVTGGNPGSGAFSYTTYFDYPSGDTGGLATTDQTGDWSLPSTWTNGNVPLADDDVRINHDVTLDVDAAVSSLTINTGATLTSESGQSRTLTITDGGSFTKNGGFAANDGSVVFEGSGAITGLIIFNSIEIAGGVAFPSPANTNDFISNSLTINEGGYLAQTPGGDGITTESDIPGYTNGVSLIFTGTFDVNSLASGWGTTLSSTPTNVQVLNGGALTLSRDRTTTNFTVDASSSLTINPARGLTVTGNFDNTGTVTLSSNSQEYSSLIVEGTATGDVTYNRFVNSNANGNDLIAPPVLGQSWSDFLSSATNANDLLDDDNTAPTTYAFGPFDKGTGDYMNYTDDINPTLTRGVGYRAATDVGTTLSFTGGTETGTVFNDIEISGSTFQEWNLIGNPYPSYIDAEGFLTHVVSTQTAGERNIDLMELSGIYGYDGNAADGWDIISLASDNGRFIAPGQGFFVAANGSGTLLADHDIEFTPTMRTTANADDFISGREANNLTFLELRASTADDSYVTDFYFNDESSTALDPGYDAVIFGGAPPAGFSLYSLTADGSSSQALALQSLNSADLIDVTIPLGIQTLQGAQLTFTIDNQSLPGGTEVYLEDTEENTMTLLTAGDYVLTPTTDVNGTGRFFLRFTNSVLSTPEHSDHQITIYTDGAEYVSVAGQLNTKALAKIYDLQGRLIVTRPLLSNVNTQRIDISTLSAGIYVIKVDDDTFETTQKFIKK